MTFFSAQKQAGKIITSTSSLILLGNAFDVHVDLKNKIMNYIILTSKYDYLR